jgi:ribosomal protein L18
MPNHERSTLNQTLGMDTDTATLAWLEEALEYAYSHGQHIALAHLEAVIEDVVFEEEITARTASVVG